VTRLVSFPYEAETHAPFRVGDRLVDADARTLVMGILNTTPDSFSDGGLHDGLAGACAHALEMRAAGADIIDVGGESTRPGSKPVSVDDEIARVIPVIRAIADGGLVSVDTMKSRVAEGALQAGAHIVNDVSALRFDPQMAQLLADHGAPIVLMHMQGMPGTMQNDPRYDDVIEDLLSFFHERIEFAMNAGIQETQIIIDPGFGFGKTVDHNYRILRELGRFRTLGRPILLGTSRKSFIGSLVGKPASERLFGTASTVAIGISNGASIVRVHDVAEMIDVVRVSDANRTGK
jgi:dihydropteroate synthase